MIKYLQTAVIITVLLLSSCASSAPADADSAGSPENISGEFSSRSQETRNDTRMIAYNASLDLFVKNPEDTRKFLTEYIRISNGYITREENNSITARIPVEKMDEYLVYAKTLGKVNRENKTGTDITDQYCDNVLRLESLRSVQKRYITLLERANSVSDILAVERELERINLEIERLEGRIKQTEQSASFSNITVRFREETKPGPIGWIFYGLYHGIKWLFVW